MSWLPHMLQLGAQIGTFEVKRCKTESQKVDS